jgi:hypothetical protein
VVTEAALRLRIWAMTAATLRGQLIHLAELATLPGHTFAVLPFSVPCPVQPAGFQLYDRDLVVVETTAGVLQLTEPDAVARYSRWLCTHIRTACRREMNIRAAQPRSKRSLVHLTSSWTRMCAQSLLGSRHTLAPPVAAEPSSAGRHLCQRALTGLDQVMKRSALEPRVDIAIRSKIRRPSSPQDRHSRAAVLKLRGSCITAPRRPWE